MLVIILLQKWKDFENQSLLDEIWWFAFLDHLVYVMFLLYADEVIKCEATTLSKATMLHISFINDILIH